MDFRGIGGIIGAEDAEVSAMKKWGILVFAVVVAMFAVYDFRQGYHPARSIAAGVVSILIGLIEGVFYGGWPGFKKGNSN